MRMLSQPNFSIVVFVKPARKKMLLGRAVVVIQKKDLRTIAPDGLLT